MDDADAANALSWIENGSAEMDCVTHYGLERCWHTFVPGKAAKATGKLPVVIDLHGMGACANRPSMGRRWA